MESGKMKRHHWLLLLGLAIVAVALFGILMIVTAPAAVAPTRPATENLDDATMNVAKNLYCPVCPGTPLDVCDTQACQQWRQLIREKLAAGQTPEQIQQYFVAEYGERVLGAPKPEGFNLTIYIAPVVAILAGAVILYFAARGWMRSRTSEPPPATSNEYRERIEQELKELE
jgi:cytochrome c-type biogenesis protein CcmH